MNFISKFFLPNNYKFDMGKIIEPDRKRELLPYIRNNLGKISQREIGKQLGIGKTSINRWSAELGFKHKKNTVNEEFFDEFNEYSSYLLGFIYADGNIAWNPKKGYQTLTITAAAKDKDHLERMRRLLSSSKPLLYSKKTNSYRLIANSKKLALKLMSLGVIPRKSLTVKFPDFIPDDQMIHFLRGVIDGDGCVRFQHRKRSPYFEISISSGSEKFINGLVQAVEFTSGIKVNILKRKNGNLYTIRYTCSKGKDLAKKLYSNSTIHLERKYLAYKKNVLEVKKNEK
jgi:hypothetical protein